MRHPKRALAILALITMAVFLAACGGKTDSPTQVATKFYEALRDGDSGTVTQLLVPEARQRAPGVMSRANSLYPSAGKITAELVNEVGNTTTVRVTYELTSEQAVEKAPGILSTYRNLGSYYQEHLTPEAYQKLFDNRYRYRRGLYMVNDYLASVEMEEGEPLHQIAWEGFDGAHLERYLTDPPKLDQAAIQALEEIASGIDDTASFSMEEVDAYKEMLRPHLVALSDYLLYNALIDRGLGSMSLDPQKKTYVYPLQVTLHRVDKQWLVADN